MLLVPRESPRLTLRRVPSYTQMAEKGPVSSTSSRFSYSQLIAEPPPSPCLPALIPRHGAKKPSRSPRSYIRALLWISGVLSVLVFGFFLLQLSSSVPSVGWSTHKDHEYEMVGEDRLPEYPTPLVVTDNKGRAKWTVSIPASHDFPLEQHVYTEICVQTHEVSHHVEELRHKKVSHADHPTYYQADPYFVDVAEAQEHGMLPSPSAANFFSSGKGSQGHIVGLDEEAAKDMEVCEKSMTFVLESYHAGLGEMLMMLWTAYGLAQKENRAFFIDDSRWAYGEYTNYFATPPLPSCRPPPRHEMIPCPHYARHLVVSSATKAQTFGSAFNNEFRDLKKTGVEQQKLIFSLARTGYEALFTLRDDDQNYVSTRIEDLVAKTVVSPPDDDSNGIVIGVHVRHGDKHPLEFQYHNDYIPLYRYIDEARELLQRAFNNSKSSLPASVSDENMIAEMNSVLVVASDDPNVYEADEFNHALRAQDLIRLASKNSLSAPIFASQKRDTDAADEEDPLPVHRLFKRFVSEAVGWEGGFFAKMFWSLGNPAPAPGSTAAPVIDENGIDTVSYKIVPSAEALRLREFVGRAYLMDLAVLGQASDALVCTVSSMGCRILAVMMGWDQAIDGQAWGNVDGGWGWFGVGIGIGEEGV